MYHEKDLYLKDLKLLESNGLLKKGTCIVAHNIQDLDTFRKYLKKNPKYKTEEIETCNQAINSTGWVNEMMSVSTYGD